MIVSTLGIALPSGDSILKKKDRIQDLILEAVYKTHEDILIAAEDSSLNGMGTTLVLAFCIDNKIYITHVGDSRAYLVRQNKLELVTEDHSVVFRLLKNGELTQEEAQHHPLKHMITQSLGNKSHIFPDINCFTWSKGDYLLLCSDGLTDMVEDKKIEEIILLENRDLGIRFKSYGKLNFFIFNAH